MQSYTLIPTVFQHSLHVKRDSQQVMKKYGLEDECYDWSKETEKQ